MTEDSAAFIPKCITDKKYTLAAALLITVLTIALIAVAVKKPAPCPHCPPPIDASCPDGWVGYQGKCYYISADERNWTASEKYCSSSGASLAVIDTKQELDFWVNFTGPFHYWIGLSRETAQAWKWPNGTVFENQFDVRGEGNCAYINNKGLSSSRCTTPNNFLCSQEDACTRRKKHTIARRSTL
ncbi:C-type lectin domain family 2 member D [Pogona vitticeps]